MAGNEEAEFDWLTLSLVPGLGIASLWRLLDHFPTPADILSASRRELLAVPQIHPRQINGLSHLSDVRSQAERELVALRKIGGELLCYSDPLYPALLKELPDSPSILFLRGNKQLLAEPCLAIVGSRAATEYGRRVARHLAHGAVNAGMAVVSGLALGIDTAAHLGCLDDERVQIIGVLGCGLDVFYPPQNRQLMLKIGESGLLVSEYPLGTRPDGFRFPARNRIIAGMSRGVLVVEAARRSGSLITAQIGLDLGREVFAVPGQIDSAKSEGTHWLLQQGAKLVQNVEDIVVELGCLASPHRPVAAGGSELDVDEDCLELLRMLEPYPIHREQLLEKCALSAQRLSELLLFLELDGLVELLPGDRVVRVGPAL